MSKAVVPELVEWVGERSGALSEAEVSNHSGIKLIFAPE